MNLDHPSLDRGLAAFACGELHEALECFGRVLAEDPRCMAARAGRARTLAALGRRPEAILDLDAALRTLPGDHELRLFRARELFQQRRLADAIADCDVVLEAAPGLTDALFLRAQCKIASGDSHGGLADLDALLAGEASHLQAAKLREALLRELAQAGSAADLQGPD